MRKIDRVICRKLVNIERRLVRTETRLVRLSSKLKVNVKKEAKKGLKEDIL